MEPRLA